MLFRSPIYAYGDLSDPVHVTNQCSGIPRALTDDKINTAWVPKRSSPSLHITIPDSANAALITLEWKSLPASCSVDVLDAQGTLISRQEIQTGFYADHINLPSQTHSVVISPTGDNAALGNLRIYGENYPAHEVQTWEPLPEKIDLLLICAHQDDEFLFFGGSIPYYAAREDVTIGVLYMTNCGRARYREALDGLWTAGLRHYPIFLDMKDFYTLSPKKAASLWRKDAPGEKLVQVIRKYKPEVILTHDFNGEYGHGQHKYTAQLVADYFGLAADGSYDPASAEKWGAWQVKKIYAHLYGENQIVMDWNKPLDKTGVITPIFWLGRATIKANRSWRLSAWSAMA